MRISLIALFGLFCMLCSASVQAQFPPVTTPAVSPRALTMQKLGLSEVTIEYSRPAVRGRKVWGELVPYSQGTPFPWRAGADENTTIQFSHEVKINGKAVAAGKYGLHILVQKEQWTFILSKNASSWGSFFYNPQEDVARVTAKPMEAAYQEMMLFEFTNAKKGAVDITLRWEKLQASFTVEADVDKIVIDNMRNELRSTPAFSWVGWHSAASYCLDNNTNLEEALQWCENSIGRQTNFTNLATKSRILEKLNRPKEAKTAMESALEYGTVQDLHGYGRWLLSQNRAPEALEIFKLNAKKNPNKWPVNVGLARGHLAMKDSKTALKYYKIALKQAPDEENKKAIEDTIKDLEKR